MKKAMKEVFTKLLGEKMTVWFGTDGKTFLQVVARDWTSAEKLLQRYFNGQAVGSETNFQSLRKELPAESSMVAVFDPVQFGMGMVEVFKPLLANLPINMPANFPAARKGKPTYAGTSVSLQPQRVGFDLIISSQAIQDSFNCFVRPWMNQ
jgi:hypothetical protein